uniref:Uncharacterized protein n=1 Tax=Knipowitschia caucasica TaxID=637954 RepID=A0AAV2L9X0_KNICA
MRSVRYRPRPQYEAEMGTRWPRPQHEDRTRRRRVHGACYSGSRTFACTTVASPLGVAIATRGAVGARTNGAENCITYASVYFTPRGWIRRSCARLPWSAEGAGVWCPLSRFL